MCDTNVAGGFHGEAPSYIFALWNLVIRPPRFSYEAAQLGPTVFEIAGTRAYRRDVRLRTRRGLHLECSHFIPLPQKGASPDRPQDVQQVPVVIYLHGNSSSRLEAGSLVAKLVTRRVSVFCFDWAGCGLSEGEYVSLGWHERDDLATVIDYLRRSPHCGPIALWGRSMGAVSALLHLDRDPTIGAVCLDSPFASLRQLIEEIAASGNVLVPVPTWLVNTVISVIRRRVKALADFDIEDLQPLSHAGRSRVPALFMHGREDSFVLPQHSEELYRAYAARHKELLLFDGSHNSERSENVLDRGIAFLLGALRRQEVMRVSVRDWRRPTLPYRIPHLPRPSRAEHRKALVEQRSSTMSPAKKAKHVDNRPAPRKVDPVTDREPAKMTTPAKPVHLSVSKHDVVSPMTPELWSACDRPSPSASRRRLVFADGSGGADELVVYSEFAARGGA